MGASDHGSLITVYDQWLHWTGSGSNALHLSVLDGLLDPYKPFILSFDAATASASPGAAVTFGRLGLGITDFAAVANDNPPAEAILVILDHRFHHYVYSYYPGLRAAWVSADGETRGKITFSGGGP